MRSAEVRPQVETYESTQALPSDITPLFATAPSFFSTWGWWDAVLKHGLPANTCPRLLLVRLDGVAAALFPMLYEPSNKRLQALTTPYTCRYEPLFACSVAQLPAIFDALAQHCRSFPITRMDALAPALELDIARSGKSAGLAVARFAHFGNWHQTITHPNWAAFLAGRPGKLRETIRRRTKQAEQLAGLQIRLFDRLGDLDAGISAFETVYARSWKRPEPYPTFNAAQIRAAASLGIGRLAVWVIDGVPAAVQFWIVEQGKATLLKLVHDEAFKAHSPGTILTAWMIRHMIDQEHIRELDFGRGDDDYKQDWVGMRRQMTGLLLINPRSPRGLLELARHRTGEVAARFRRGR